MPPRPAATRPAWRAALDIARHSLRGGCWAVAGEVSNEPSNARLATSDRSMKDRSFVEAVDATVSPNAGEGYFTAINRSSGDAAMELTSGTSSGARAPSSRRLEPLRHIDAGVLDIAYYEAGPADGPDI